MFVKNLIKINGLIKPILGFSIILGACAVIFVGVDGGFHSPLAASVDSGAADSTTADAHTARLLPLAANSGTQSHY